MPRIRRPARSARLLLAVGVGGAVFGIATAVQASIPDANGVIHGCYNTSLAHGNPTGALRVIDTAKPDGNCASWETPLSWNESGPTGPAGATGPTGATGPAGPTYAADGVVEPDGTILDAEGPTPTVTHPATGQYGFSISGVGYKGCPWPQLTADSTPSTIYWELSSCGAGTMDMTVFTGDGSDHGWSYMLIGRP